MRCSQGFPSSGPSECVPGLFWPKNLAVFCLKLQFLKLRAATSESRSRPPALNFLLTLCVTVPLTFRYDSLKFHPNLKHQNGIPIVAHFAPAAACCLLLLNEVGPP